MIGAAQRITFDDNNYYGCAFIMPYDGTLKSIHVLFSTSNNGGQIPAGVSLRPFAGNRRLRYGYFGVQDSAGNDHLFRAVFGRIDSGRIFAQKRTIDRFKYANKRRRSGRHNRRYGKRGNRSAAKPKSLCQRQPVF